MTDRIIQSAQKAHLKYWSPTSDESIGDKQATAVTTAWQEVVLSIAPKRFRKEVKIGSNVKARIDIVDDVEHIAYELKVSGKNPHLEFFKDIFKVITYNHNHRVKLRKLIFLTESTGLNRLKKNSLASAVVASSMEFGVEIYLKAV